jgi:hypothetical protein
LELFYSFMGKFQEWRREILKHKYLLLISLILLALAITLNYATGIYVDKKIGVPAPDLILDNIPTLDLDVFFTYGFSLVLVILLAYPLFFKVEELHKAISQFSLLVLVRSFFVSLTHLSIPANALVYTAPKIFAIFDFQNALFFSGHTAIPFLGFLLFRKEKIGIFFLIATVILAATVLFMHVHYSIDVFSALFITYGCYKIGEWFFKKVNGY